MLGLAAAFILTRSQPVDILLEIDRHRDNNTRVQRWMSGEVILGRARDAG